MKTEKIILDTPEGEMNLHLYHPMDETSSKGHPAILVLQEAFGVNANIQAICERFSRMGFLAAAPELFHRSKQDLQIPYSDFPSAMKELGKLTNANLAADVKLAFDYLKSLPVTSIGTIGFCMGGFTAILGACRVPLDFAISCYGGGLTQIREEIGFQPFIQEFNQIHCPLFLIFGEKDTSIPLEQVENMRGLLKKAEREYEIKIYRGAGHAFMREGEKCYHPDAANEAWKDIESWLSLAKTRLN